ncbi:hypothetical protein P2318_24680 [Myxococcaceae bacterium GXIMD 01537]
MLVPPWLLGHLAGMDKPTLISNVAMAFELLGPLLLGVASGVLFKKFVFPKLLARLGGLTRVAYSPANILASAFTILVVVALAAATHAAFASETLAWLAAHPRLLPIQPTPTSLKYVSMGATWFSGYLLATFPADPSSEEDTLNTHAR